MEYKFICKLMIVGTVLGGLLGYFGMFAYELITAPPPVKVCSKITENHNKLILQCKDKDNG